MSTQQSKKNRSDVIEHLSNEQIQRGVENYQNMMAPITRKESASLHKRFLDKRVTMSTKLGPITQPN